MKEVPWSAVGRNEPEPLVSHQLRVIVVLPEPREFEPPDAIC
jgi:hypothetical protein